MLESHLAWKQSGYESVAKALIVSAAQRLARLQRQFAQHLDVPVISTQARIIPVQYQHHKCSHKA